jgi:hypothetical protein
LLGGGALVKPLLCRLRRHKWINHGTTADGHLRLECRCGVTWLRRPNKSNANA